jgi:transcriptional regulator with XRE-family HTH domain
VSWRAVPRKPDYRVILGATIRQQRKRAELTLEVLAEKAELHPNYLGRVERGEEHVSLIALRRLATALKLRVRDLVAEI